MKIMYINATYEQGSHGMMVSYLHQHMKHLGHDSYVCYGRGKKVNEKSVYKIARH